LSTTDHIKKIDEVRWEIPTIYRSGMRVPGRLIMNEKLFKGLEKGALDQCANVATLPGIYKYSIALPDTHWGYGFPIGGVAAFDMNDGVVSPGGVGYDINCGVRILTTSLDEKDVRPKIKALTSLVFDSVPSGVGATGRIRIESNKLAVVLEGGAKWAIEQGYGWKEDLERTEEKGCMEDADADKVSSKAKQRGAPQLGTLGSGNHYLETQTVEKIFDEKAAKTMGITHIGQVTVMIHSGSRGCGHQIASDYIHVMEGAAVKYKISLPDRQLACAPVNSREGADYLAGMRCGANYAWANRQCIAHWVRESFQKVFAIDAEKLGLHMIYDVAHNIAKIEEHDIDGKKTKVCVHRKGATRSFAPNHPDIPSIYSEIGQPVLVGGSMGTASYVLVGTHQAMNETFGSTCHGAGRTMSRAGATRQFSPRDIMKRLESQGIEVQAASIGELAEEASESYKNVDEVVDSADKAGISKKVVRLKPLSVIKG
jgi:tRNA-splicing ligase RtcB